MRGGTGSGTDQMEIDKQDRQDKTRQDKTRQAETESVTRAVRTHCKPAPVHLQPFTTTLFKTASPQLAHASPLSPPLPWIHASLTRFFSQFGADMRIIFPGERLGQ